MAEETKTSPFFSSSSSSSPSTFSSSSEPSSRSTQEDLESNEPYIVNTDYSSSSSSSKEDEEEEGFELQEEEEDEDGFESAWRQRSVVMLEGYVESGGGGDGSDEGSEGVGRTKSLTDDDLEELKGCLDLGFGFSYEEIPELCETLPALELCYSLSQRFLDEQHQQQKQAAAATTAAGDRGFEAAEKPNTNWRISGPGDDPEDVKARLKYWAQAVACTVRLCS